MDWANLLSAGGLGVAKSLFGGGGRSPSSSANDYLNQIPGMEHGIFDPYINHGNEAYGKFNPITSNMLQDPAGFLEKMMQSYEPSRGFQMKKDQMLKEAGNSAAAGGMRGSMNDIGNEAKLTDMLMGDDMQQWLKNVFGIQEKGLTSQEHLYDTGFDASKTMGGDLANVLGTQATLAFQDALQKQKSRSDMMSGIGNLVGTGAGYYFGGPAGGAAGGKIGSSIGSGFA